MTAVLIVDDKEENLYYLQVLLSGHGYQVTTARHGAEALVKARQGRPGLVVSDLLMPVMDGYTLLRHWKADPYLKTAPFIVYTATYTEAEDERLALDLGADAFLLKPTEPDEFVSRLQSVLAKNPAAAPLTPRVPLGDDSALLKVYSETLIRKLEEKTLQLEESNRALQQDIAERMRVEEDLRASQTTMATAQRIARFGSWELDMTHLDEDGEPRLSWSDEVFRIAGLEPGSEKISRERFLALVHPADRETIRQTMARSITNREPYSLIHRIVRPDGSERIVHETAQLFYQEDGTTLKKMIGTVHDITDQRLLTRELELERSRLVAAQRIAKIGSWDTDISTGKVIWSEETYRIFEDDPARFSPTHNTFLDRVHPEDRAMVSDAFASSLKTSGAHELEHRISIAEGRTKHVIERWEVFHDASGTPHRALGTTQDITERKLAENEIQRTTHLLQAVADETPDALFVKDLESRYLLFNEAAARFVGVPAKEVLGKDDTALFGTDDARLIMELDRRVIESGESTTTEEVLTAGGITRTYLATKAPYRDTQGKIVGTIGISRDITEQKASEEALRQSESRYRTAATQLSNVLDSSLDVICSFDSEGRFLQVNAACDPVWGYTPEELMGTPYANLVHPEDRAKTEKAAALIVSGHPTRNFENRYVRKDGRITHIQWAAFWSETEQIMFCAGRDVTEKKNLEAQFLRAQRMESIGTLAGGIAHDLNNVLAPIMMSIDLLKMQESDPFRLEVLSTIESSAKRGADMVKQVLTFARGVEGKQLEVKPGRVLREIEKIANETFLKNIMVRCSFPTDLWMVRGDPTQLHQVLLNLSVNARDAMPGGGTLTLSGENIMLDQHYAGMNIEATPGPYVVLQAEDTGTGMPPEVVERIFEPFFTTKDTGKGTGLGLSTSLAIIKSHGGFLRVYSEVGLGTKFRIYLPALPDGGTQEKLAEDVLLPRGHGELVLVVDDESAVRQITRQTLEAFGYEVLLACDGVEAVAIFTERRQDIAVVITDMMMPVMDGHTTIPVLLRMNPAVKIIAASGLSANGMVARATNAGVKYFIPKPYTAETLLKTLHDALHPAP